MQQLNFKTHTVFWILIKCLIQYCDNLDRSILSHWTPCLVRKMGCNTWRVLLRKNIRNRHLTVWWCMMQHAHVSSTYVIIHYLEYNCESPSSTYGGPTRSAVRHSSVTPIILQLPNKCFQIPSRRSCCSSLPLLRLRTHCKENLLPWALRKKTSMKTESN